MKSETQHRATFLPRFSIWQLLAATTAIAVGCAALLNANKWWGSVFLSGTLTMLIGAIMLAVYRRNSVRAYWFGFALSGFAYLGLAQLSLYGVSFRDAFITTKLSKLLFEMIHYIPPPRLLHLHDPFAGNANLPASDSFVLVAHFLWTLAISFLGGNVCRWIYHTREPE